MTCELAISNLIVVLQRPWNISFLLKTPTLLITSNKQRRKKNKHVHTFHSETKYPLPKIDLPKPHITTGVCISPIKKMMLLSLLLSYTASTLFVPGGRPIQKFLIRAGLRDTKDPSRLVLQKCAPFQENGH